jgi:hypothetical protein
MPPPPPVKGGVIVVMFRTVILIILWPQGGGRGEDAPSLYIFDIFASLSPREDPRCVQDWLSVLYLLFKVHIMTSFLDLLRVVYRMQRNIQSNTHPNIHPPPLQLTSADTIEEGIGQREGMGLLEYQAMPSLRDVAHDDVLISLR